MPSMVIQGQVQTGQAALDFGITDLMVMQQNGQTVLYASSGQTGGLSAFNLSGTGSASILDTQLYDTSWSGGALRDLALVEVNGAVGIAVAGSGADQLRYYTVDTNGSIGTEAMMSGMSSSLNRLLDVDQSSPQMLLTADTGAAMIRGYYVGVDGAMSEAMTVADTTTTYAAEVMSIRSTSVGNSTYTVAASQMEKGVSVYRMDGNSLINTGNAGVNEGLGIMTPTAMEVVVMGGRSFVILASAPNDGEGQSGAITVMELAQDGSLVDTDHVIDTALTRFGQVQSLEVLDVDGRTYVMAGGGDDGMTMFVLLPNGRLQILGTISGDAGLNNISSIAARYEGGNLQMYVASETSGGVLQISADVSNQGMVIQGGHGGGTITGGAQDDILIGGAQNDSIIGGAGDDIIEDGLGVDTMSGGSGADIFVLRSDFTYDVIQDFEAGIDRLDLSSWPFLYDAAQIGYTATSTGAILNWRGETLELFSLNGQTLSFAQVQAAVTDAPNRAPDFSAYGGNDGAQTLEGSAIDDAINAGGGNDTITTFAGDDYIDAGIGDDIVDGGAGRDTIEGGAGDDTIDGWYDSDLINGGAGNDYIQAGLGSDTVYGGDGDDLIRGNRGLDLIYGGEGSDLILGDNNDDTIYGEGGNDYLRGGNGNDLVDGGIGNDHIFGANQEDVLYGGEGNDIVRGGYQSDTIFGGGGDDYIVGGGGFDVLTGGEGNDTLTGAFNADRFVFEDNHGHDVVLDFEADSRPEKLVFNDLSTMNSVSDVLGASVQQGANVVITTSANSSITLIDVQLSSLDEFDFIF